MYKLYASPGAASFAVHWMLRELNVPFELKLINMELSENHTPAYLNLNPKGTVPTLVTDETTMTESIAILMWLAERYPHAKLAPQMDASQRSEWYQWMVWIANDPMPLFRNWLYPDDAGATNLSSVQKRIEGVWTTIDEHLETHRFVLGEQLSCIDMKLYEMMRWSRRMPNPAITWNNIRRYLRDLRERRTLKTTLAAEGLRDFTLDG